MSPNTIHRICLAGVAALVLAAPVGAHTTSEDNPEGTMLSRYGWGAAATVAKQQERVAQDARADNRLVGRYGWGASAAYAKPADGTAGGAPRYQAIGLTGDSALTRSEDPQAMRPASPPSDGVDWSWFGLGAGLTALLAAGIAGVALATRRRGGVALP